MDRRDALKRLAAGSATAVGASVILSQPAFAFTNPTVTGSPTVTITTTGALTATIAISNVPAGSCPGSALSKPAPSQVSLTWETFWPGNNQVMSTGTGTSVSISSLFQRWFVDDRIRVTMVYRYQCVYGGSTATVCVRWFREFHREHGRRHGRLGARSSFQHRADNCGVPRRPVGCAAELRTPGVTWWSHCRRHADRVGLPNMAIVIDRREAQTKLAIGRALAAGGSVVLPSKHVAVASSIGDITGL